MKKTYLLLTGIISCSIALSQTDPGNLEPISITIEEAETPAKTISSGGSALSPTTETMSSELAPTTSSGPLSITADSESEHKFCPTHELTKAHYESLGMSWEEYQEDMMEGIEASKSWGGDRTPGTNTISVIFHVVHDASDPVGTGTNVSNAAIMNVFNDLVEDYSLTNTDASDARSSFGFTPHNPEINFCLATQDESGSPLSETGVIRVATTEDWFDSDGGEENDMKSSATGGSDIWDRDDYLNVWICDISNGASSGTAGYAYKPTATLLPSSSIDGIVLDYNLGVNNDNVLTHEVGHYLGLDHTWGGSGGCGADDGFSDTPNTAGPSFDYSGSCSGFQETCSSIQTQYENYMDYSNCTVMFTEEQSDYMMMILTSLRSSLMLSPGCDPTDTPPESAFSSVPTGPSPVVIAEGGGVDFIDESTNAPTGWSWSISGTEGTDWDWTGGSSSADQNPSAVFYNAGFYDVTLTASNAFGSDPTPADSVGYVQVVTPTSGTECDTVRDYDPLTEGGNAYLLDIYGPPWEDWGYLPGHGAYDFDPTTGGVGVEPIYRWAEKYNYTGTAEVRRLRIPVFLAEDVTGGEIRYSIHEDGATPGTMLVQDTVPISDLLPGYWNELDFSNPATVTGNFWVQFELDYGTGPSTQDTVIFTTVDFADRDATTGVNDLFLYTNGTWYETTDLWTGYETSLYMDVLLSNGPDPVADMDFSDNEICAGGEVTVNGSGSTNVTDYFWNQWDPSGPSSISTSNDPSATFDFPSAGSYEIYLFADGSCKTSGLMLPVTVNDPITFSTNITHTSCGNNNGEIEVTGEAGGDGTYEYKLEGGSWGTTSTFTDLPADDYTVYVRTDGDNCESQTTVTINPSTPFVAGIDPNSTICPGDDIDISASGGSTYEWYDGSTLIGTTPTVNVSPSVTTLYSCIVTDGSGCESNVSVTITVDPLDDASFNFYDFCFGAANGAVDIATPGGTFSFFDDPTASATIDPSTGEIGSETLGITYTVQYDVAENCANSSTETVTVNSVDDPSFTTDDFCEGDENVVTGVATAGGTFSYDVSDASSIDPSTGVITDGVTGTTYTIKYVTPSGVCQDSSTVAITVEPNPVISDTTLTHPLCNGDANGEIDIVVTGASPTSFDWGAAGTAEDPTGLTAGTYDVTVEAGICSTTGSYTLIDPPAIVIDSIIKTDVECNGESTGTAVAYASGGTPSLTYDFGSSDEDNLPAGVHTVTVTDGNGCTEDENFTISEPTALGGTATTTMDDGSGSGTIDLTPSGGTPPYTFSWDNGDDTEDITDLPAGDYEVTITDDNGCTTVLTFTVESSVGVEDNELSQELLIYPNPTLGVFTIELSGDYQLEITDARGRLILSESGNDKTKVDLSKYERGVYMIRVRKESEMVIERLVKK